MTRHRLVCATANAGKVAELSALLDGIAELEPRPAHVGDIIEDADTLEGNARLKAEAICAATGAAAVADDTGLDVDALDGQPGVHSARFAGAEATDAQNRALLLERLDGVASVHRTARFRTVIVVHWPDGTSIVVEGVCEGRITDTPRGDGGFGYDAVFEPSEGNGLTFAEMPADAKNAISHRGRAVRRLAEVLSVHQ